MKRAETTDSVILVTRTTIVDVSEPVTVKPTNTITSVVTFTPIISVTVTSTNSEDPPEFIAPTQTQESTPASTTLGISAPTTSPSNPLIPSSTGSTLKTSARPSVTSATSNASSQVTSSASTTSSETSTPTEQAASSGRGKSKGPVIGGAIGAIAFLVLLGVFIWWYKRRQAKARKPRIVAGYRAGDGEISKPAETGLARADSTPSRSWQTSPDAATNFN
ncbi:hypothetical protein GLAREA_12905 [Glarea lozoyensis ATCC 20868]|uniref:Mid2 domain-containing protein n=1 Tax=Glarea lozoyensis (strain ATCC 20868 / MF5171) TaxID=1116229 RepID=S3CUV4_GLAL2|nr:uncharacterized protein GLAREA_12905 [Glarea lozoyensis ATCC 20868]EPE30182.1 hypothetical protein GLAREA_12905 [Glarea lozoyensis ATCC 20868]